MGILDKLKPQPRWKHSDPAVRLQAIPELGDPIELATLAEHDPDAKVRRAAIEKVDDPVVLGRVTTSDADSAVQEAAADRLLGLALDASNHEAATAAGFLADTRRVSLVAKSSAAEAVREVALGKLTDERALGRRGPSGESREHGDGGRGAPDLGGRVAGHGAQQHAQRRGAGGV